MIHVRFVFGIVCAALALSTVGCSKGSNSGSASSSAPAANLPTKGPWDAVKITYANKKDPRDGSPMFVVENTGSKPVTTLFIDFYGYDAKGNQVAKRDLSYNSTLKGGEKDSSVYTSDAKDAVTWEATYHGIQFSGEDKPTMDPSRAPAKKPKGK